MKGEIISIETLRIYQEIEKENKELQQENEILRYDNKNLCYQYAKEKTKIDKAIKIILKYKELQLEQDYLMNRFNLANYNCYLLDILQGEDNE